MAYEQSLFGDGVSTTQVTNVHGHFGARESGKTNGIVKTEGFVNELTIDIDGDMVSDAAYPLLAPTLPAGAIIEDVYLKVTEAFVLGGTTPAIEIGTETSESTNGFTITEAQAEATGTYDVTAALSGTWAAGLAAATTVGLALSGTSPTVTSAGKARVVIRYIAA